MKPYEFLNHPAELRIRVFSKTKEGLFKNAAEALADILTTNRKRQEAKTRKGGIKIKSTDLNTLLVDFLNEILAKSQIDKCVYFVSGVKIDASRFTLYASCAGYPVDHFDEDIKAVTYQDVDIKAISKSPRAKNKLWQTDIVFDV